MHTLTIIIVGYNEEINLPELFLSLKYIKSKHNIRVIYIDQSSTDASVKIAKEQGAEVYIHENKGYADPDKKWAVEELCKDNDWILILDCDETLSKALSDEILHTVSKDTYEIINIYIESIVLGGFGGEAYQPRLFKKSAMKLSNEIHNYLQAKSQRIGKLKNKIRNDDLKFGGKEISSFLEKTNRYGDIEILTLQHLSRGKVLWRMFWKPIQRFFGFGIVHKQFLRGTRGLMVCMLYFCAQFLMYAKLYEKKFIYKKK